MKKAVPALAVLLFIGGVVYVSQSVFHVSTPNIQMAAADIPYTTPTLSQDYKNSDFNFELSMPADFTATETDATDDSGGKVIVLQDKQGNGIQITVTPFDEDMTNLTEERIHEDVPDLKITDAQPVQIGDNDTGLAFKSDNADFDGASREVWFVFRGDLYQISTYDRLDPLLKSIFATWKFL